MLSESVQIYLQGVFSFGQLSVIETCVSGSGIADTWRAFDDVRPA